MTEISDSVTAFAPASVGNVGVGFDTLGHAVDVAGDRVSLARNGSSNLELVEISGLVADLPSHPASNTALRAIEAIRRDFRIEEGASVHLEKGIPLGSGMGGSAASAAAGVTAAAEFWQLAMSDEQKLGYALEGEAVASGDRHADNVAPSLFGGLVLCEGEGVLHVTRLPVPDGLSCVLIHPHLRVETREARGMLSATVSLADHVRQTQALAGFVAGCYRSDVAQLARCLRDFVVEPQRSALVPGFADVKRAAMENGALGSSLSGSGPSVFAWSRAEDAVAVRTAMVAAFDVHGVGCDAWISPVGAPGARIETAG
jgi:homoserine kinase